MATIAQETPLYQDGTTVITRSQAIIGNSIFPIASISSVSTRTDTHGGLKVLGAILLLLAIGLFASGAQDKNGTAEIVWAVIMAIVAVAMLFRKQTYIVQIITHGKTFAALTTPSETTARSLNSALSNAIAQR